jgi:hypothetical protein
MPYSPFNAFYLFNSYVLLFDHEITVPHIGLIIGTRAMLGAGIVPSFSEKLTGEKASDRLTVRRHRRVNDDPTCVVIVE